MAKRYDFRVPEDATNEEVLDFLVQAFKSGFWTFQVDDDSLDRFPQLKPYRKWLIEETNITKVSP